MANFFDAVQDTMKHGEDNKILTQNGAVAYASAGDTLVDFSYSASNLRNKSPEQIMALFERCYIDNPVLATKMMFQMGDVREGKGERRTFNACLNYMAVAHPEICKALLHLVPEYTRWDHVAELTISKNPTVAQFARQMMAEQLRKDFDMVALIDKDNERRAALKEQLESAKTDAEKQKITEALAKIPHRQLSLCAKWAPSLGSKENNMLVEKGAPKRNGARKTGDHHLIALKLSQTLFKGEPKEVQHKKYRQMRAAIIKHLNVAEQALSAGRIEDVDLEHMTAGQQAKYGKVMQEKNTEAYNDYLDKVEAGEAKMNADVKTPADIVHMYTREKDWGRLGVKPFDRTTELMWQNLKQVEIPEGKSCIVVRDDSGSMTVTVSKETSMTALEVATALSLYCAERLPGEFKDKFISFSENPKYLDVSKLDTLHDRLRYAYEHAEVSNTDVKAVFDLLLKTALKHKMSQADIPGTVLLISDMEFDAGTSVWRGSYSGAPQKALFEEIRDQWKAAGYEMPVLAFWNLNPKRAVVPTVDDRGVVLLSGFTTDNLDMVMNGDLADYTPAKQLEMVLSKPRYDAVEQAFYQGLAAERKAGTPEVSFAEFIPEAGYSKVSAIGDDGIGTDDIDMFEDDPEWDDD